MESRETKQVAAYKMLSRQRAIRANKERTLPALPCSKINQSATRHDAGNAENRRNRYRVVFRFFDLNWTHIQGFLMTGERESTVGNRGDTYKNQHYSGNFHH